ncbi:hypothetical protein Drorol1_Dr00003688 [Drosera rotundifolia]
MTWLAMEGNGSCCCRDQMKSNWLKSNTNPTQINSLRLHHTPIKHKTPQNNSLTTKISRNRSDSISNQSYLKSASGEFDVDGGLGLVASEPRGNEWVTERMVEWSR